MKISKKGNLFVVTGSSGSGKTTIVNSTLSDLSDKYPISRVVTYTTKTPRKNEKDGRDYHFISEKDFESKLQNNFFIEYSKEYGAFYGSPSYILQNIDQGCSFILITDFLGLSSIKDKGYEHKSILINTPIEELETRLKKRSSDSIASIKRRIEIAQEEEKLFLSYNFNLILNNLNLKSAIDQFKNYICYQNKY